MSKSSRIRREGREAYDPGSDWKDFCPYFDILDREDFHDGWQIADDAHDAELEEAADESGRWEGLASTCPWRYCTGEDDECIARSDSCTMAGCAIWHFVSEG